MRLALAQAAAAAEHGDVPIGAVVARDGEPLAAAGNERELRRDPTAHAEVLALRAAAERLGGWRIADSVLYVTLEPCAMCAGAIVLARVPGSSTAPRTRRPAPPGACSTSSASRASTIGRGSTAACSPTSPAPAHRRSSPLADRGTGAARAPCDRRRCDETIN